MTAIWSVPTACEACSQPLPIQPFPGNPIRFGCEACRKWRGRHQGQTRTCTRCAAIPTDSRHPWDAQMDARIRQSNVIAARREKS